MSQTVKYVVFDSNYYSLEISDINDKYEIAEIASNEFELSGEVDYEAFWFEFGAGESGTDEFISENEILEMLKDGKDIEEEFYSRGYEGECIESSHGEIDAYVEEEED